VMSHSGAQGSARGSRAGGPGLASPRTRACGLTGFRSGPYNHRPIKHLEARLEYRFTEEQESIRRTVREFAETRIRPRVMEYDESQQFPMPIIKELGDMGMLGILVPENYGGAGLGYVEYVIVIEELSRVDGSVGLSIAAHNSLCTGHLYHFGTEEQRQKYVVPLAQGKW